MFHSLPCELFNKIVSFIDGDDVLQLSYVNKQLHYLCQQDSLWLMLLEDYRKANVTVIDYTSEFLLAIANLKTFYINVIKKWGWLIGLWQREIQHFGGLLQVKLEIDPCRIVGYDVQASEELEKKTKEIFVITIDLENLMKCAVDKNKVSCTYFSTEQHFCKISMDAADDEHILFSCDSTACHDKVSMKSYLETTVGRNSNSVAEKLTGSGSTKSEVRFCKISVPLQTIDYPVIKPGYFAGDYSTHGSEIVSLQSDNDSMFLTKISGDENVKAGLVSISVNKTHVIDYAAILRTIAKSPRENFSIVRSIEEHTFDKNNYTGIHEDGVKNVSELIPILKTVCPNFSFGLTDEHSFVDAFQGAITLRQLGGNVFYNDVIVVVTDAHKMYLLWQYYDENHPPSSSIHGCYDMGFNRLVGV